MKNLTSLAHLTPICLSLLALNGCVTAGKDTLPQGGDMTMEQIYKNTNGLDVKSDDHQLKQYSLKDIRGTLGSMQHSDYQGYTRTATNEINNLFKPMDNPEISMYVYPRLVQTKDGNQYPIPGFTTGFFLFSANYYAMPSEHY